MIASRAVTSTISDAHSCSIPVRRPRRSRSMTPLRGSTLASEMPAAASASEFADADVTARVLDHQRVVGRDPVELVDPRVTPVGQVELVVPPPADPPTPRRSRRDLLERGQHLADRAERRRAAVDPELGEDAEDEVVVHVDEPRAHDASLQVKAVRVGLARAADLGVPRPWP